MTFTWGALKEPLNEMRRWSRREVVPGVPYADALLVTTLALGTRLVYWLIGGTRRGADTAGYLDACSVWATNPADALTGQPIGVEYAGFTLPFCVVTNFLGAPFDVWIAIQILLSTLSCLIVYATAKRALNRVGGLIAGLSMVFLWESFQWTIYLLSDALFVFAVSIALWAVTRHADLDTRRTWAITWLALTFTAVTRPFGLPLVLGWLAYDLLPLDSRYRLDLAPRPGYMVAVAGLGALYLALASRGAWVDSTLYGVWSEGTLVMNDPTFTYPFDTVEHSSTLPFVLSNAHHLLAMGALKIGLFLLPLVPRWSLLHNVINLFTLVPVMFTSVWALLNLIREDRELLRLWVTPLVVFLIVVGVTFVDWDWRYRAPAAPVFSLFAGYAAYRIGLGTIVRRVGGGAT